MKFIQLDIPIYLVLFDLDGTLVDTAPDLAFALNVQRRRHGLSPLPENIIRPYANHGSAGLINIGFGVTETSTAFAELREEYLNIYKKVFLRKAQLFDGISIVLDFLDTQKIPWGVVTNKIRRFSEPLIEKLHLTHRLNCLICGDDVQKAKPDPEGLLRACQYANISPKHSLYVGDSRRDITAGNSANMLTVLASYGYIEDDFMTWQATAIISHPQDLLAIIS